VETILELFYSEDRASRLVELLQSASSKGQQKYRVGYSMCRIEEYDPYKVRYYRRSKKHLRQQKLNASRG